MKKGEKNTNKSQATCVNWASYIPRMGISNFRIAIGQSRRHPGGDTKYNRVRVRHAIRVRRLLWWNHCRTQLLYIKIRDTHHLALLNTDEPSPLRHLLHARNSLWYYTPTDSAANYGESYVYIEQEINRSIIGKVAGYQRRQRTFTKVNKIKFFVTRYEQMRNWKLVATGGHMQQGLIDISTPYR